MATLKSRTSSQIAACTHEKPKGKRVPAAARPPKTAIGARAVVEPQQARNASLNHTRKGHVRSGQS